MTLLDYFAGQAIQGAYLASISDRAIAEYAYRIAEAMLNERQKRMKE